MALIFVTSNPRKLLSHFVKCISEGHVVTWSVDSDGDFTHSAVQWNKKAWLTPKIRENQLEFYILPTKGGQITKEIYGVYHGRFAESMLVHCDELFSEVRLSAMPAPADVVTGSMVSN